MHILTFPCSVFHPIYQNVNENEWMELHKLCKEAFTESLGSYYP